MIAASAASASCKSAFLNGAVLFVFRQELQRFQIGEPRAESLVEELFADVDALPNERLVGFELADCGRDSIAFGLLLRALAIERGELGPVLLGLLGQELPLHGNERPGSPRQADETRFRDQSLSLNAARNRAMSSCAATRSFLMCSSSAVVMVGSSSIRTSPALTLWPSWM